jgi:spermidine synthase
MAAATGWYIPRPNYGESMNIRPFCFGVALTSAASLALSLLITRIFSVTMYYHFAFLLVSLALLGVAVSGVAIYLLPKVFTESRLTWLSGLFAVAIAPLTVLALYVAVNNPMSVDLRAENVERLLKLYFATSLPFLSSGFAISLAIMGAKQHIGRVYAFDLVGAAVGCLLIIPLISQVGGPGAVLVAGGAAALGGGLIAFSGAPGRAKQGVITAAVVMAAGVLFLGVGPAASGSTFKIAQGSKWLNESSVEFDRWNAFSRVTVSSGEADHKWIMIDADAATRIYSGTIAQDNYQATRRFSEARVASLVYALRNEGPALIIGPGGGADVVAALRVGVPRIVGVEVNPLIVDTVMRGQYAAFNGDLYRRPGVELVVDDGRSFVRRSKETYSSIQATLVDTWAASSAGAFTLSENNLYTVEAFSDYLDHLQPDGVLSMTRWFAQPPREFLRLMGLGREALNRRGVPELGHREYFYVVADNRMATMLLKRQPFRPEEVEKLNAEATLAGLTILYAPTAKPPTAHPLLEKYLGQPSGDFYAQVPYDVSPTDDNRPFFFNTVRPREFAGFLTNLKQVESSNLGLVILQILVIVSVLLTVLLVVLPLFLFRRDVLREERRGKVQTLGYFLCLGLGFILVELGLMQHFILFLGHPIYALAVVLATLLAASGLGSALSSRIEARFGVTGGIRRVTAALSVLLLLYMFGLPSLFGALLGQPIGVRIAIAAVLVGGLGALMGTLLPLGVRRAQGYHPGLVPWAWGLNGATSVMGSILATVLSLMFGFTTTLMVGLLAYVVGGVLIGSAAPERAVAPAPEPEPAVPDVAVG